MANPSYMRFRSQRTSGMESREVLSIMAASEQPGIISFAGGLPDPRAYPVEEMAEMARAVAMRVGAAAFGYTPTEGIRPLREQLAAHMSQSGRATGAEEVLVTAGGMAALDLIAKALLDPGDVVLVEDPTYMAALSVLRGSSARIEGVASGEDGLDPNALEEKLDRLAYRGERPKLLYTIPSFHNPAGTVMPQDTRARLARLARERDFLIVEDATYEALWFDRPPPPPIAALAPDRTLYVGTYSKLLCPGLRLGWVAAPSGLVEMLALWKQGQDQCSTAFGQHLVLEATGSGLVDRGLARLRPLYRRKRELLLQSLARHMPDGTFWRKPGGGFFVWMRLPRGLDAATLLNGPGRREGIAYVPGQAFFHDGAGRDRLRLSYSYVDEPDIEDGVIRLGRLFGSAAAKAEAAGPQAVLAEGAP
jgi:2-aminoadipate transaminase